MPASLLELMPAFLLSLLVTVAGAWPHIISAVSIREAGETGRKRARPPKCKTNSRNKDENNEKE